MGHEQLWMLKVALDKEHALDASRKVG